MTNTSLKTSGCHNTHTQIFHFIDKLKLTSTENKGGTLYTVPFTYSHGHRFAAVKLQIKVIIKIYILITSAETILHSTS